MDMPIYLQLLDAEPDSDYPPFGPLHRWYVIEERADQETAADDELGKVKWIYKSENLKDRVRRLRLPNLDYEVSRYAFAASNSRLFFVGGFTFPRTRTREPNGVVHIDLQHGLSWERYDKWGENISYATDAAAGVSKYGDSIYVVMTDEVLCFRTDNVEVGEFSPLPKGILNEDEEVPRLFLAMSGSNMLLYAGNRPPPSYYGIDSSSDSDSSDIHIPEQFGFYNVENGSWNTSKSFPSDPIFSVKWPSDKWSLTRQTVLVSDSFMMYFGLESPSPMAGDFGPALYVYDIKRCEWLPKPVQGLPIDGSVLPSLQTVSDPLFDFPSLMQVRRDALKFAMVWSARVSDDTPLDEEEGYYGTHNEIHWAKFILRIHDKEEENIPPTFYAESMSYGVFNEGESCLVNCASG